MTLSRTNIRRRATPRLAASQRALAAAQAKVAERSGGNCEGCASHPASQFHHRKARQAGGSSRDAAIHSPANLLHLCLWCHEMCESHPDRWTFGWKVHRGHNPAEVSVLLTIGSWQVEPAWFLLDDGGGRCAAPDGGEAT
jgi:hypothetical protein